MRIALVMARRELASLFRVPVGWIAIALFLLLCGVVFGLLVLIPGQAATMRSFFALCAWLLLPIAPAISMRLLSDEYRSGTIEPLMTSPASDAAIVTGKYLGAAAFLALLLAPTLVYPVVLVRVSDPPPDAGPIAAGYLSLVLLGLFYLAVGLVASALTSNQTLAFMGSLMTLVVVMIASVFAADALPAWMGPVVRELSLTRRVGDFAKGVIDTSHVVFFLAWSAWLVVIAVVVVASRRWR